MSNAFMKGDRVEIKGFRSFFVKNYKPHTDLNPKAGEKVQIPPKRLPFFKCGKELKGRVDSSRKSK
jgi:integration host factor subunit beta